jgi:site-specific DNA recombinase
MKDYYPPPRDLGPGATVWAYLRDSGGPTQENSVTQQENALRAFCERYGLNLIEVFKDIAKSGGSVEARDEFNRMIAQSEDADLRPRGLLIWDFARFARNSIDSNYYKAKLRKNKIIIHSLTDPIPSDDFAARIVETVLDLATEDKRRRTSEDVKRGLQALVKAGFAPGTPPKGYKRVPVEIGLKRDGKPRMVAKWERDPDLWDAVIQAWTMRADNKSYREIQEATRLYSSVNSWNTFFKNRTYLGYFGDVPDHHEAAITQDLWDAVQGVLKSHPLYKNSPMHPRRISHPNLLTGFAYCATCGAMMTHTPGSKSSPWRHYVCGTKDRHGRLACPSRRVGERPAEDAILNAVLNRILTPDYLEEVIETARARYGDTSSMETQITNEQRKVEDLDIAIQRALNAHERTGSKAALDRLHERERERAQAMTEINRLKFELEAATVEIMPEAMQIVLATWKEKFTQARQTNDIKQIRSWLMRFVSRVELGYQKAKIFYTYPMMDFDKSRVLFSPRGGTLLLRGEKPIELEWSTR